MCVTPIRRRLAEPLSGFKWLIRNHSSAAAFHRCEVRRHCLSAQHGLDLVGWPECPQAGDRDEHHPVAIFVR
jgi:hypothetical protein